MRCMICGNACASGDICQECKRDLQMCEDDEKDKVQFALAEEKAHNANTKCEACHG